MPQRGKRKPGHLQLDVILIGPESRHAFVSLAATCDGKTGSSGLILRILHGFEPDTPPAARWQPLARQKLHEIDALIERAQHMKHILQTGLNCGCLRLEDCAIALEKGCCEE